MKKKQLKKLNPARRQAIENMREIELVEYNQYKGKLSGKQHIFHKWVTLPNGSSQIINLYKHFMLGKKYNSEMLNKEMVREMANYSVAGNREAMIADKHKVETPVETAEVMEVKAQGSAAASFTPNV